MAEHSAMRRLITPRLLPTLVSAPLSMPSLAVSAPLPAGTASHVAVIGAGAAGLVAARELRRRGHGVVVLESGGSVGGTWVYTPEVEADDPLSLDQSRGVVHSSLYASLRTNLPRESMGFLDYPFREGFGEDPRRFPSHAEVLRYLEGFARDFNLIGMVRFETEVVRVERDGEVEGRWMVTTSKSGEEESEEYDAVVVCNGHYTEPRVAKIPGVEAWPGKQMHSHNYRVPNVFLGQVVVLIGSSSSAADISRDISGFAKEVHVASRSDPIETPRRQPEYDNMWLHSMVARANMDGTVDFRDGSSVQADVILHCTGYKYHFPFLKTGGLVTVDDNRVGPLYKHIFPPSLSPGLSFIGIPWKVIPFPLFELQSKWVAGVLSGQCVLPSEEEMMMDIKAFYSELEASGKPKRYTHGFSDLQLGNSASSCTSRPGRIGMLLRRCLGCMTDRKSTTGFCTCVADNLVIWRSKKQQVVFRSSAELEYTTMAQTTTEMVWVRSVLHDLHV